jgi:DNA-binding transcriptional regulator YiaG
MGSTLRAERSIPGYLLCCREMGHKNDIAHLRYHLYMTAKQIKAIRSHLGLSQQQLATRLGVSFATVNRWENGHTKPQHTHDRLLKELASDSVTSSARRLPVFGTLAGKFEMPEDKYLLNEPPDVLVALYGDENLA